MLILGGSGMLGHKVWQYARACAGVDAFVTLRRSRHDTPGRALWDEPRRLVEQVDARAPARLASVLDAIRPDVVINAIGITKAHVETIDPAIVMRVNSTFPHEVAALASARGIRTIHVSTDCVFRGDRGAYREADVPDADDLYGRSKARGEPSGPGVLTLRTSMVGRELAGCTGLLEWFLAQRGRRVTGYRQARFSGLTTPVLAAWLVHLARQARAIDGLFHVAADPIDKHTLLGLFDRAFAAGVTIDPADRPCIDRTLDGRAFVAATGLVAPDWSTMVADLYRDETPYDTWRSAA